VDGLRLQADGQSAGTRMVQEVCDCQLKIAVMARRRSRREPRAGKLCWHLSHRRTEARFGSGFGCFPPEDLLPAKKFFVLRSFFTSSVLSFFLDLHL
jgi:hypothetical protein